MPISSLCSSVNISYFQCFFPLLLLPILLTFCLLYSSPQCTKQILSEKLGRGSRTVDLDLEAQIEVLRDNKQKYEHVIKLAQTLCTQLAQMLQTQRQLGDVFADLSLKTPELHASTFDFFIQNQCLFKMDIKYLICIFSHSGKLYCSLHLTINDVHTFQYFSLFSYSLNQSQTISKL